MMVEYELILPDQIVVSVWIGPWSDRLDTHPMIVTSVTTVDHRNGTHLFDHRKFSAVLHTGPAGGFGMGDSRGHAEQTHRVHGCQ